MSVKDRARELFEKGFTGVIALREVDGVFIPHLFTRVDVDGISEKYPPDQRYPVAGIIRRLFSSGYRGKIGVVARGCDERALVELIKQEQIDSQSIAIIGLACEPEVSRYCECDKPYPSRIDVGSKTEGVAASERVRAIESMSSDERLAYWLAQFSSCIKCMGCKNICPVCFCRECSLEQENLVSHGRVPPDFPIFHLLRAVDMASRCVDCGLCEESCPSGIPLRALYKKSKEVVRDLFGYKPGFDTEEKSPLSVLGERSDLPGEGDIGGVNIC